MANRDGRHRARTLSMPKTSSVQIQLSLPKERNGTQGAEWSRVTDNRCTKKCVLTVKTTVLCIAIEEIKEHVRNHMCSSRWVGVLLNYLGKAFIVTKIRKKLVRSVPNTPKNSG